MYSSPAQLPLHVATNLDSTQQQIYLSAYNLSEVTGHSPQDAAQAGWEQVMQQEQGSEPSSIGYWVDLAPLQFDESQADQPRWIQAFPYGTYHHPVHGLLQFTADKAQRMAEGVKANLRGQDLDIDYDHKAYHGGAAGWVKDAEARADGLWLAVQFTRKALSEIKDKVYRYFSPDYWKEWTDPRTQQKHNDVLCGGALTNRPFLKGIMPINLSEIVGGLAQSSTGSKGGNMDPARLAALRTTLGLPDTATEAEVTEAALARAEQPAPTPPAPTPPAPTPPAPSPNPEPPTAIEALPVAAREELVKLAESTPAVRSLLERTNRLEAAYRLGEVNGQLSDLTEGTTARAKGHGLPTVVSELLRPVLLAESPETANKIIAALQKLGEVGMVKLGETGYQRNAGGPASNTDAEPGVQLHQLALARMKEADGPKDYKVALNEVMTAKPELANAFLGYNES